jgi:hypothetical protein
MSRDEKSQIPYSTDLASEEGDEKLIFVFKKKQGRIGRFAPVSGGEKTFNVQQYTRSHPCVKVFFHFSREFFHFFDFLHQVTTSPFLGEIRRRLTAASRHPLFPFTSLLVGASKIRLIGTPSTDF